jgi:hypothetical protein
LLVVPRQVLHNKPPPCTFDMNSPQIWEVSQCVAPLAQAKAKQRTVWEWCEQPKPQLKCMGRGTSAASSWQRRVWLGASASSLGCSIVTRCGLPWRRDIAPQEFKKVLVVADKYDIPVVRERIEKWLLSRCLRGRMLCANYKFHDVQVRYLPAR